MTDADVARRWYATALQREAAGDLDGAAAALDEALRLDPWFVEARQARERVAAARRVPLAAEAGRPARPRLEGPALLEYDVAYPQRLSRWRIFVKWLLAVPHFVVLYFFGYAVALVSVAAWFAILFTGRYPRGLFGFVRMYLAWTGKAMAYTLLRDEYPSFGGDPDPPVTFALGEPARLSRWLLWVKWLLVLPNALVLTYVVYPAFLATALMALVAVPATGRYPEGLFRFAVGTVRWSLRLSAYLYLLTDRYPPFDMRAGPPGSDLPPPAVVATEGPAGT